MGKRKNEGLKEMRIGRFPRFVSGKYAKDLAEENDDAIEEVGQQA